MWRFVVITDQSIKDQIAEIISKKPDEIPEVFGAENNKEVLDGVKWFSTFFKDALAVIAVFYILDEGKSWQKALDKGWPEEKIRRQDFLKSLPFCFKTFLILFGLSFSPFYFSPGMLLDLLFLL
ncbi:MAG TPA: hypothetical protein DEA47_04150 [Peptococcaceae bacterium]|nr:MAG: hypothetical protein XD50_0997 [Clostridia bacterium 41_269]HBT20542.1 hypothetical protein [Peptococcaceae bacterium]